MLRVVTLGGLALERSTPPLSASQVRPQGLGLLARLAAAGERGVSRDKIVGCFWPEKDERAALHSLSQALHRLRAQLDTDDIVLGTRILRLNPARVTSDAAQLDEAHRAHDARRVVELYRGPFLDGIYFSGAPELEHWVENERLRLAGVHASALRTLARSAVAAADHDEAARWWRELLALDPLDGSVAAELIHSLASAGDEGAALREARHHLALVRAELQAEPNERVRAFIDAHGRGLREGSALAGSDRPQGPVLANAAPTTAELCARARQCFYRFTREGFAEGIRLAERAVRASPEDAEAHVTLGALCIILSQAERAGDPRARGVEHCTRAAALAPTLSEPRLFLAWAAQLDERFEEAEVLAQEGLSRDPGGVFAHTVLGWVRLNWGLARGCWSRCVAAFASLHRALEIQPSDAYVAFGLAALYMLAGGYDEAFALLDTAIDVERWAAGEMRCIGGLTLQGLAHLHAGRIAEAGRYLDSAFAAYADAPQIYAPYVNALTCCGLGDLARLDGRYGDAASHYSRGRSLIESETALIGGGHLMIRLETRLASVFHRLRMRPEEERHATAAHGITSARAPWCFNWCWGVSEAEMHYDWAVYHAECTDREAMAASLDRARDFGWHEVGLLDIEPAFAFSSGGVGGLGGRGVGNSHKAVDSPTPRLP